MECCTSSKLPGPKQYSLKNRTTGSANLVGQELAPYWEEARFAGASFQEIRDGVLLFVDPCSACDQIFSTALQVREQFPVVLAVDHLPSAELDSYLAYFEVGDLPVMYETVELRRVLPVDYWPTVVLVRDGRVVAAGDGSATVSQILIEAQRDWGLPHKPFQ